MMSIRTRLHRTRGGFSFLLIIFTGTMVFFAASVSRGAESSGTDIMLQAFGWDSMNGAPGRWYDLIASRADDIAASGFTIVWFPPASRSVSQQGYLPGDYYDLGTPENSTFYGNKDSLRKAVSALKTRGVKCIADIVINHRCAGKQDENGLWNIYKFPSGKAEWEKWAICGDDYKFGGTGNQDTGAPYDAAPDIDHENPKVRADIIEWLKWMKNEIGFDGWRYDYAIGYAPGYVGIYDRATSSSFSVGEIWTSMCYKDQYDENMRYVKGIPLYDQNPHRQKLCDWLDRAGTVATTFDFTTKGILQEAVKGEYWRLRDREGKASGLIGWWPERAVTFIDNHDTGSAQSHWPFPSDRVITGYAYILTHPGIPCVFWEHFYDWNLHDEIARMMKIRKAAGIKAGSKLQILRAENNLYAAIIDSKLALKLGITNWNPGEGWQLLASGHEYAIWGKGFSMERLMETSPAGGKNPGTGKNSRGDAGQVNFESPENVTYKGAYYPGYGETDPDYDYKIGREISSELLKEYPVINRLTIFRNEQKTLYVKADLLPELLTVNPSAEVRRKFPFILNGELTTVAQVDIKVQKKLFFRNEMMMADYKIWLELLRAKKRVWPLPQTWEVCGKTYILRTMPASIEVGTEFRVLE